MAFIIPNAVNTASGAKFSSIDQAEPDSIDFEVLGNTGRSGVIEGLAVTLNDANSVAVASGKVLVNGTVYSVAASTSLAITAPTDNRFALVVARVSGSSASLSVVYGNDDGVNPYYPESTGTSVSGTVDLSTDIVLAAVYRVAGQDLTSGSIVDKRVFLKTTVTYQGTTAPSSGTGSVGELYFSKDQESGTNSGLYVKGASGWVPIQQNVGPQLPVGSVIGWPSATDIPDGFLEANGQLVAKADYPELANAWGYNFVTNFALPDLNGSGGSVLKGTTVANGNGGTAVSGSSDTRTLVEANLPSHTHGLNSHTHTLSHTHGYSHTHTGTAATGGSHTHNASSTYDGSFDLDWSGPSTFDVWRGDIVSGTTGDNMRWFFGWKGQTPSPVFTGYSPFTASGGSHSHTVSTTSQSSSTTDGASTSTTSGPNTSSTTTTGSGSSFNNVPKAAYVVWIVRATSGDSYPAGTSIYESSRQETFAISYEGTLPSGSAGDVSAFRLPWAATLISAKASLDGVGVTASGADISVDVKLDGTTVFGANKLTIEDGESSSNTAATPPDISTTTLTDDSLVSIDILNASGETGPLNVVLYVRRNN